ncbi:hypothetical protein SEA_CAIN_44 [Mycobacterium phage Cain]|uniref:Uncharacterized protein n=1 Tax=Mycobacterium phage Bryler TaxID=2653755 RepID=A0A5Q2WRY6_9CAUD|nr:hypothetical protein I5G79_gp54 [Mycobacterium phage Bryler]ASR85443.1 hypothetical protein SEA_CAIN_44 [Mycobacterium phage Cain]QGH80419.1 hypothetical protein SEA_BRYLER_44 [Mycobacterium phage Bryler]
MSHIRDIVTRVMAEVDREPVEESVRKWRAAGRHYAKLAQELFEELDDGAEDGAHTAIMVDVTALAALATMYFTLAQDVQCFGKLPAEHAPGGE